MSDELLPTPAPEAPAAPLETTASEAINKDLAEQTQEPTPAQKRALRILASEVDLPETLDDQTFSRLQEITKQINQGVDRSFKEAAQLRQQAEQAQQQARQFVQQQQQFLLQNREVAALAHDVGQYENVDWFDIIERAPDQETKQRLRDLREQVAAKKDRLGRMVNELTARQQYEAQVQAQNANQLSEALTRQGEQFIKQFVPQWNEEAQKRVISAMAEYGVGKTMPALDQLADFVTRFHPAVTAAFHDAALYRAGLKKAQAESESQLQSVPTPRPVSKVGGNASSGAKDPDKMTTEEWLKWRNAQLRKSA